MKGDEHNNCSRCGREIGIDEVYRLDGKEEIICMECDIKEVRHKSRHCVAITGSVRQSR